MKTLFLCLLLVSCFLKDIQAHRWRSSAAYAPIGGCRQIYTKAFISGVSSCGPGIQVKQCLHHRCRRFFRLDQCPIIGAVSCNQVTTPVNCSNITTSSEPGTCSITFNSYTKYRMVASNVPIPGFLGMMATSYIDLTVNASDTSVDPLAYIVIGSGGVDAPINVSSDGRFCLKYKHALATGTKMIALTLSSEFPRLTKDEQVMVIYSDIENTRGRYRYCRTEDGIDCRMGVSDALTFTPAARAFESFEPFLIAFVMIPNNGVFSAGRLAEIKVNEGACTY